MNSLALAGRYDFSLVTLSVLIAIMAAYVVIDLAGRVTASQGRARFLWLTGGAVALGTGIWSMHFSACWPSACRSRCSTTVGPCCFPCWPPFVHPP